MANPVPEWSGVSLTTADDRRGIMRVHHDDQRLHKPPTGWRLVDIQEDEDDDADIFVYDCE